MSKLNTIGIDVAKNFLDICVLPDRKFLHLPNNESGFKQLLKTIKQQPELHRIVIEHTGGYQKRLAQFLLKHDLPVSVINPARARFFAKASGRNAKTDTIDAELLAQFGATHELPLTKVESAVSAELRQLVHRRGQLVKQITCERNRLDKTPCKEVLKSIKSMLKHLEKECEYITLQIQEKIKEEPELEHKNQLLCSVSGIGRDTAALLLAGLPELGSINRREIASLVGLAPINRDSGGKQGHAYIRAGRGYVRQALYMPTLVACTQCNPVLKAFYKRLRGTGKPTKMAITACMRKMLVYLNSMLARDYATQNN